ncbi:MULTISPECIES: hypothetical protein [unclassified Frondihabitans]|uniref:hypothetical protein n=1 Tax=unclassified Frondihabitans TaxID=2626248 RepID=UPI000F4E9328|nr:MULTISPECIES: hypothetical protein [unclassified Frondihabitans]RPE77735.1 hypothetical protein EDF37_0392 [Frondihabitans sp. PhB153]RPF08014.1 hypothetical protein EDF39_0393 [Frondihabitans sp. PhB161]
MTSVQTAPTRARARNRTARSNSPLFDELAAKIPASTRPLAPILPKAGTTEARTTEAGTTVAGLIVRMLDDDTKATRRWPFHSVQ